MTLRWVPGWNGLTEPEAVSYVAAVEAADEQELEFGVARAINDFVLGCKTDGIWDAIKASCILAGARTRQGALVPLRNEFDVVNNIQPANPQAFNFVDGDYDRKTGLVGDASTKYLTSNRNNNADPQGSQHLAVWASSPGQVKSLYISASVDTGGTGASGIGKWLDNYLFFRSQSNTPFSLPPGSGSSTGLIGISRPSNTAFSYRAAQTNYTGNLPSQTPIDKTITIFGEEGSILFRSNARLAFYSIGEALPDGPTKTGLELLDERVSDLITAIGAAIP